MSLSKAVMEVICMKRLEVSREESVAYKGFNWKHRQRESWEGGQDFICFTVNPCPAFLRLNANCKHPVERASVRRKTGPEGARTAAFSLWYTFITGLPTAIGPAEPGQEGTPVCHTSV